MPPAMSCKGSLPHAGSIQPVCDPVPSRIAASNWNPETSAPPDAPGPAAVQSHQAPREVGAARISALLSAPRPQPGPAATPQNPRTAAATAPRPTACPQVQPNRIDPAPGRNSPSTTRPRQCDE